MRENNTPLVVPLIAAIAIGAWIVVGKYCENANIESRNARLSQVRGASAEYIKTSELQPPAEYQVVGNGKYSTFQSYWALAETKDWLLLNSSPDAAVCRPVLRDFVEVTVTSGSLSLAEMQLLAAGFKGRELELQVMVPRFKSKPANLGLCPGFGYDEATGRLKVGDKFIAYLMRSQPRLTDSPLSH